MRFVALAFAMVVLAIAGCASGPPWAAGDSWRDITVTLESSDPQSQGLPLSVIVRYRNQSNHAVEITLPRPACPEADDGEAPPVTPGLAAVIRKDAGHNEAAVWTDPDAATIPAAHRIRLAPGEAFAQGYELSEFPLDGASGPDDDGALTSQFSPGQTRLELSMVVLLSADGKPGNRVESNPLVIRCTYAKRLFKTARF